MGFLVRQLPGADDAPGAGRPRSLTEQMDTLGGKVLPAEKVAKATKRALAAEKKDDKKTKKANDKKKEETTKAK